MTNEIIQIKTREHLLSTLSEASELEHNLICLYLFAHFCLKEEDDQSLNPEERLAVKKWSKVIKDIAIQEMGHLALVANLTCSIGGSAHFYRPNFPVRPGYYPADFVVELAPFDVNVLEHFIFLERPEDSHKKPNQEFRPEVNYERQAPDGRLMTHTGEYATVGTLYEAIGLGFANLTQSLGESKLFCGQRDLQIDERNIKLTGLIGVSGLNDAQAAIKTIVEQGEGGSSPESHFQKFIDIKKEYDELLKKNPEFKPSRDVVRNPVMRKSSTVADDCNWIGHETSALYLDLGNALYGLMIRLLIQVYSMENRTNDSKNKLLNMAFKVMHALGETSRILPNLPASDDDGKRAGMSFTLNRHFSAYEVSQEMFLIKERIMELIEQIKKIRAYHSEARLTVIEKLLISLIENEA